MKNLKKVFAVVIALSMILSTAAFAAVFSDVADNAAYTEAIELGASINLFTGYEDGSFKPEGDITRAEFAAIIVRMLGQEAQSSGAAGATKFADVPSTHWAAGYINIVTNLGIVNGYGDGNFGPEDNVTYEQAVKMCVVALGYEPAAAGNYPVGYLTIAQQRGVTTSVKGTSGVAINRGQVAQMAFNSLDVPLMTQTGFGTYIEYVINDGTNNTTRKTLLSENLDIVKIKAMVEQTYDLSSSKKESLVQVEVLNAYRSIYGDKGEKFEEDTKVSIDAGKTNLKSFVGYNVIAYVAYNDAYDDDPVALYVTKDISSADEITIAASDIEDIVKVGSTHYDVSYMASKDARSAEKFSVDAGARVYYNGQKDDRTLTTILNNFYGTATFALNDSRNTEYDYDTVYVLHYENAVVESVNLTAGRVSVKEGKVVYFGDNQPDSSATLYDVDGKELEWSELEENDVLSIRRTVGTNNRNVYVCTLVRNVVEGVITEKTSEDDAEFKIGGAYYKTDNGIVYPDDLDLQYEGVFYLDIFGRIAYYEAQSSLSSNYAFVID
ncbi:MAG: S-layer homology domain-containing protein, partial [Firmicutes bacterium]|nr:S-layer homology domain-containing protein [Bacillota bacterium]